MRAKDREKRDCEQEFYVLKQQNFGAASDEQAESQQNALRRIDEEIQLISSEVAAAEANIVKQGDIVESIRAQVAQDQRNLSSHLLVLSKNTLGKRMA